MGQYSRFQKKKVEICFFFFQFFWRQLHFSLWIRHLSIRHPPQEKGSWRGGGGRNNVDAHSPYREADERGAAAIAQTVGHDGDVTRARARRRHRHPFRPEIDADGGCGGTVGSHKREEKEKEAPHEVVLSLVRTPCLRGCAAAGCCRCGRARRMTHALSIVGAN